MLEERDKNVRARPFALPRGGGLVTLRQDFLMSDTGGALWDSSFALLECLGEDPAGSSLLGRTVLELGSGVGAVALGAVALGAARVLASDCDAVVLTLLRANVAHEPRVHVVPLRWGSDVVAPVHDVLLAADVLYDAAQHDALVACVRALDPPRLVLSYRKRERDAEAAALRRLDALMEPVRRWRARDAVDGVYVYQRQGVYVYEWRRRSGSLN